MWTLERGVSLVSQDLNPGLPDSVAQDLPPLSGGDRLRCPVWHWASSWALGPCLEAALPLQMPAASSRRTGSVSVSDWTATLFLGPGSLGGGGGRTSGVPGLP